MPTQRNLNVWPPSDWWLSPSGYHEEPYDLLDYLEAPAIAHPLQGALTFAALLPFGLSAFLTWYAGTLFLVLWQAFSWERLDWVEYPLYNIVWRVVLGTVPLAELSWGLL